MKPGALRPLTIPAAALVFFAALYLVSQGSLPDPRRFLLLVVECVRHGLPVIGWLAAAAGWGALACLGLEAIAKQGHSPHDWTTKLALGVGLLAMLDAVLGWFGLLNVYGAWGVSAVGWAALAGAMRAATGVGAHVIRLEDIRLHPAVLWAMPAAAWLIGTATIAPGVLWASEFGAYDALSYHLQLPVEWLRSGRITGLEHNVYSYLPGFMEAAYTHLAAWGGVQSPAWAVSAQLLHASMALLTACVIARTVMDRGGTAALEAISAAVYLATPWTLVTGSLAYNEQAVMLLGAAALRLAINLPLTPPLQKRDALVIGLLCGLASMMKLTAAGMVALPVLVVLLLRRCGVRNALWFFAASGIVVLPWAIRNGLWTGNPLFPMFTGLLGTGHWTAEQAARWDAAHSPHVALGDAMGLLLSMERGLFHGQYGVILFGVAMLAVGGGLMRRAARGTVLALASVAVVQALFWLTMTHHQPRFLVPLLLPAIVIVAITFTTTTDRGIAGRIATLVVPVLLSAWLTWCGYSLFMEHYSGQAVASIGGADATARQDPFYAAVNTLPPDAKVYCEAFATPFYFNRPVDYRTVWDAGPLGSALAQGPHEARRWLKENGYTHVIIHWVMLHVWLSPNNYGYDPRVTPDALGKLVEVGLEPMADERPGPEPAVMIYRVR